jgi:hypothetical protein
LSAGGVFIAVVDSAPQQTAEPSDFTAQAWFGPRETDENEPSGGVPRVLYVYQQIKAPFALIPQQSSPPQSIDANESVGIVNVELEHVTVPSSARPHAK